MRTSFHHQPEAQHPNFLLSTSWQADYPIFWGRADIRCSPALITSAMPGVRSEAHDNRLAAALLSRLRSGSMLLADRGYDADSIRAFVQSRKAHGRMRAAAEKRCLVLARRSRNSNC